MAKGAARPSGTTDEPKFVRVIVGLPPELDRILRAQAAAEDRQLAWIIRKAIEEYLGVSRSQDKERAPEGPGSGLVETAWGLIANAGGGDWERESQEWHAAAVRWRDEYHAYLDSLPRV